MTTSFIMNTAGIAASWQAHAPALAAWTMEHLVNRTDAHGQYLPGGGSYTSKDELTLAKLESHSRGVHTLGLHLIGLDNMCRSAAWDWDQHDEADAQAVAAKNMREALELFGKLERLGLYPLLEDSDGKGGIHVWVLFAAPRHARDVHHWAKALAPEGCEVFPKQTGIAATPGKGHYGNFIRLPGKHHKRDHWSRFFIAGEWFEGADAIDLLLNWTPSDTEMIPVTEEKPKATSVRMSGTPRAQADESITALQHLQRLNPTRADDYDDWLHIGMILHDVDSSPVMLAAWDAWSQKSTRYEPGICEEKWATFEGGGGLGLGTLIMWANQDSGNHDSGPRSPSGNAPHKNSETAASRASSDSPSLDIFQVVGPQGVTLRAIDATRTPKKISVKFEVVLDGHETGMDLTLSDTAGAARQAWSALKEILALCNKPIEQEAETDVKAWLTKQVARKPLEQLNRQFEQSRAQARVRVQECDSRSSMQEIAGQFMRKHLDLRFIVPDPMAVWSERHGILMRQSDFMNRIEPGLLEAVREARDYAAPTINDPTKPIKHVQQVLKPVWCDITDGLPREVNADLKADSKAAAAFRREIEKLWLAPETWMKFEATTDLPTHVERMSLASRVRELIQPALGRPEKWQRVLKGVNAFFRVQQVPGQDPIVWLGMRVDLLHGEIKGHTMPGIETQHDLAVLANRYGITDTTGVPVFITDKSDRRRLVVLSRAMCDYLICCEDEADPQEAPLRAAESDGATQLIGDMTVDMDTGEVIDVR